MKAVFSPFTINVWFIFCIFISILYCQESYGGWFGPSNYEECIQDKMKNLFSSDALYAARKECVERFPPDKPKQRIVIPKENYWDMFDRKDSYGFRLFNWYVDKYDALKSRGDDPEKVVSNMYARDKSKISLNYEVWRAYERIDVFIEAATKYDSEMVLINPE